MCQWNHTKFSIKQNIFSCLHTHTHRHTLNIYIFLIVYDGRDVTSVVKVLPQLRFCCSHRRLMLGLVQHIFWCTHWVATSLLQAWSPSAPRKTGNGTVAMNLHLYWLLSSNIYLSTFCVWENAAQWVHFVWFVFKLSMCCIMLVLSSH